jgi:HD-GYP domain-containing protein (c-di-GMP phosphodiesterase class II)
VRITVISSAEDCFKIRGGTFLSVISSKNVRDIIVKTLEIVNKNIMRHGQVTSYILYKMLEQEHMYTDQELIDFNMIGLLHDIGLYREPDIKNNTDFEVNNVWAHSIYGFLFLKYLSPLSDKAELVLYHHLDYCLAKNILTTPKLNHILACLSLADKLDTFMHIENQQMDADYFTRYRDIKFSGKALDLFHRANANFHIMEKLSSGEYIDEMNELFSKRTFSEKYIRGFLEMLIYTIDFRSEHTVVHTMSTVNFADQLGRLMRLDAGSLYNLHYGAMLHDLGKIAIPLEILESTGRLSKEEFRVMKAHVQITEIILKGIIDEDVLQIAIRHHEKLDGSGYHRGLSEKDLTLPQQIVAVADILSALYGKRSYKDSFDPELIKKILSEDAENGKINQAAVNCVLNNYDSIITTYEKEKQHMLGLYWEIKKDYETIIQKFKKYDAK